MLKAGQVAVVLTDWTRSSLAVAFAFHTPWTHVVLGLGEGKILNTYPGTNAEAIREEDILKGRTYHVLDLPDADESWREPVVAAANRLLGARYLFWPCSRLTAAAFIAAGVDVFKDREPPFRTKLGLILPSDFLSHTRLAMVATVTEDRLIQ